MQTIAKQHQHKEEHHANNRKEMLTGKDPGTRNQFKRRRKSGNHPENEGVPCERPLVRKVTPALNTLELTHCTHCTLNLSNLLI